MVVVRCSHGDLYVLLSGASAEVWVEGPSLPEIPDEVRSVVRDRIGEDELTILEELVERGPTTDTVLAEALDTRTSTIRRALYQLYEERIADYEENRDREKGWLTFVWDYTPHEAMRALNDARKEAVREIEAEIEEAQEKELFACEMGHARLEFADAMDVDFHCPECEGMLEREDRQERVASLEDQLNGLRDAPGPEAAEA